MSPSSSSSDPFRFLTAAGPVAALTSARAWVEAVLDVEAALAGAQADAGDIPLGRPATSPGPATSPAWTSTPSSTRRRSAATC